MFFLEERKFDNIIDRIEALKLYSHRYLRDNDTYRSNCFIRMLISLPASNFNNIALQRKAKVWHDKLLSKPINISKQGSEIEIVPYEYLWEEVLHLVTKENSRVR